MFVKRLFLLLLLLVVTACSSPFVAPLAPSGLNAIPEGNSVLLEWEDNSSDELGFSVYRAELNTTVLSTQDLAGAEQRYNMQELAQLPANTTTYEDTSVIKGKRYRYAVTAQGQSTVSAASTTETIAPEQDEVPVADDVTISTTEETAVSITLTGSDVEATTLTFSVLTQPANGSLSGTAPTLMYTPDSNFVGTDSFTYSANDGEQDSNTATVSITVTNTNDAPVFTSTGLTEATQDVAYTYSVVTTDTDAGDSLSITAEQAPAWLSLTDNGDGTATLSGTPTNADVGEHDVVLIVTDAASAQDTQSFSVTVTNTNDAPIFTSTPITGASQDAVYSYSILTEDADTNDSVSITVTTKPDWLTVTDNEDGSATLSGTPTNADVGNHDVTLTVTDSVSASTTQSFTITVSNVNDAPIFTSTGLTEATQDVAYTYSVVTTDTDTGDSLSITAEQAPAWLSLTDNGDGTATLAGTPLNADVGSHDVELRVTDAANVTATQAFSIIVTNVNDAPVVDSTPVISGSQDALYSYAIEASDVDAGDSLSITATTKPAWLSFTDNGDGTATLSGTPTNADVGEHDVTLTITDNATANAVQSFTITVANVNDVPVISGDEIVTVIMSEDSAPTAFELTLSGTDIDNDTLSWQISSAASNGAAAVVNGVVSYTPTVNYNGSDSFTVEVSDGLATDTVTVNVTIEAMNDAPVITGDDVVSISMSEDSNPTAFDLTLSATDIENDTLSWQISNAASHGGASVTAGVVSYTPTTNYNGSDSFVVEVSDGTSTDTVTVNVTIDAVNDAPMFDSTPVAFGYKDTLYNYAIEASDVDGNNLSITVTSKPTWLSLTDNGNGSATLSGTPTSSDWGEYSVVLKVSDGTITNTQSYTLGVTVVTQVAAGFFHSLALKADGTVVVWGQDVSNNGILDVPSGLNNIVAIAANIDHNLALKADGTVVGWGDSDMATIPAGLSNVVAISAGRNYSIALKNDGTVVGWGDSFASSYYTVPAGLTNVKAIAAGYYHNLALKEDGTVVAWGGDSGGYHGETTVPAGLTNVKAIAAGYRFSLALKTDGTIVAWGNNDEEQLDVPSGLSDVTAISAQYYRSLALKSDGTVVTWGNPSYFTNVPSNLQNIAAISVGISHNVAIRTNGTVYAWGLDAYDEATVPEELRRR